MTIEERIFERKRFLPEKMLAFGFTYSANGYIFETDFMNGDFHAIVTVQEKGGVAGTVIDTMNREEYMPLRVASQMRAYVNSVRTEYEQLLEKIADACCSEVLFAFDQANRIAGLILQKYEVRPDFPWGQSPFQSYGAFRHADSKKWFALILNIRWDALLKNKSMETVDVINLKTDPEKALALTAADGVYPGYHMNRRHWISVVLNGQLSDERIMELVETSFSLTCFSSR